jgi:hypothetical protein
MHCELRFTRSRTDTAWSLWWERHTFQRTPESNATSTLV